MTVYGRVCFVVFVTLWQHLALIYAGEKESVDCLQPNLAAFFVANLACFFWIRSAEENGVRQGWGYPSLRIVRDRVYIVSINTISQFDSSTVL